jgi:hypothetical protein
MNKQLKSKILSPLAAPHTFGKGMFVGAMLLFLCGCNTAGYAQSWVWGKRGGGSGAIEYNPETIQSLAVDSQRNIYATSVVSSYDIDIDGHALVSSELGQNTRPNDAVLVSFGCDGSYRWSKLFHGQSRENLQWVHTDAQDNVYVTGFTYGGGGNNSFFRYPDYLGTDVVSPQSIDNPDYWINFVVKYNSNGQLQWLKRVHPPLSTITNTSTFGILGYELDPAGNSFLYVAMNPGTYFDGALTVSGTGVKNYIVKLDPNGNFVNATFIDMQLQDGYYVYRRFYRNPNNGNYYISASKNYITETASFGGQAATKDTVLACFSSTGQFQWLREDALNTGNPYLFIVNMTFDSNNDVYLELNLCGSNYGQFPQDSFLGYSIVEPYRPIVVMKTTPNVDSIIWTSKINFSGVYAASNLGGIVLKNNEVSISNWLGSGYTWGSQTSLIYTGDGGLPSIARLNKTTGACIGLSNIPNNNAIDDNGDVLAVDAHGDYIMGGQFHGTLYFDNNQQIVNNGDQTDFFIAKFAAQPCAPLAVNENEKPSLNVYPNPTTGKLFFDNGTSNYDTVSIYNCLGQLVSQQQLSNTIENTIDMTGFSHGVYLLQFKNETTSTSIKVIKE